MSKGRRWFLAGMILLSVCIVLSVLVPLVWPYSYSDQNAALRNSPVSLQHWFGTDKFGRDLFARVWYGAGISLLIGITSALINGGIGILWGALSGYAGRRTDLILMRIADMIAAVPSMLYVILITLVIGSGAWSMILGLCVAGWTGTARVVRGEILRLKGTDFAAAAGMEGIPPLRILLCHLLPNASGPVVVSVIFLIPQAVFTEAFLSFLGVGLEPPAASLGTLIRDARSQLLLRPGQMFFPLIVLCILLTALNLVGTALEENGSLLRMHAWKRGSRKGEEV